MIVNLIIVDGYRNVWDAGVCEWNIEKYLFSNVKHLMLRCDQLV